MASARLVIHAAGGSGPLQRLRLRVGKLFLPLRPAPTRLQIDDLHGGQVYFTDAAGPLTDVPLPAGTYHVSVRSGDVRRRYTVALESGATVELYLHPAADPP